MAPLAWMLAALLAVAAESQCHETGPITSKELWDTVGKDYDKTMAPNVARNRNRSEAALPVNVHFRLVSMLAMQAQEQMLKIKGILISSWIDERLAYNATCEDHESIVLFEDYHESIWRPQIYIANSADGVEWHNRAVWVAPDGHVSMAEMGKFTLMCSFNLERMPYDVQHCGVILGSFRESGKALLFTIDPYQPMSMAYRNNEVRRTGPRVPHEPMTTLPTLNSSPNTLTHTHKHTTQPIPPCIG